MSIIHMVLLPSVLAKPSVSLLDFFNILYCFLKLCRGLKIGEDVPCVYQDGTMTSSGSPLSGCHGITGTWFCCLLLLSVCAKLGYSTCGSLPALGTINQYDSFNDDKIQTANECLGQVLGQRHLLAGENVLSKLQDEQIPGWGERWAGGDSHRTRI